MDQQGFINSIDFSNNYRILKQFESGRRRSAIFRTKKKALLHIV